MILLCCSNNISIPCTGRNCLTYWVFHWTAASTTYEVDTTSEKRCFQKPLWTGGAVLPITGKLLKKKKKVHLATNSIRISYEASFVHFTFHENLNLSLNDLIKEGETERCTFYKIIKINIEIIFPLRQFLIIDFLHWKIHVKISLYSHLQT